MENWIINYYSNKNGIIRQKDFKESYDNALDFYIKNKRIEREKGIYLELKIKNKE